MPVEETLNKILKEMWRIDEKLAAGEVLENAEREFYNEHLITIQTYYAANNEHWEERSML